MYMYAMDEHTYIVHVEVYMCMYTHVHVGVQITTTDQHLANLTVVKKKMLSGILMQQPSLYLHKQYKCYYI